eukprot:5570939-Prorocentrum_lima.AAC.1
MHGLEETGSPWASRWTQRVKQIEEFRLVKKDCSVGRNSAAGEIDTEGFQEIRYVAAARSQRRWAFSNQMM